MTHSIDPSDEIWDLLGFSIREGLALRSFLEYLRTWPDSDEKKMFRVQSWRSEVAYLLGTPKIGEEATELLQKLQGAPPEAKKIVIEKVLEIAQSRYFESS
jgi:hypothetical protein